MKGYRAALFDLDGVIVDTAKYHYQAWKRLAESLGFEFTLADNERLKGVSRIRSLEILLEIGNINNVNHSQKEELCNIKNNWYIEYISKMDNGELLRGAVETITFLRENGIKTALATASKNSDMILRRLRMEHSFNAVIDGNAVKNPKPDPEVFLRAAEALGVIPNECVVFEDSRAGIEAARKCGMYVVGIGDIVQLREADTVIPGLYATPKVVGLFGLVKDKELNKVGHIDL